MALLCDPCDRWFDRWTSYRQHMINSSCHNYCDDCNRDFVSWHALRQHYIQSPEHHYCRECNNDFGDQPSLIMHCLGNHFYCERCDKFLQNATGLHEHNRQSHHYCVECRRVFNSESNLRSHMDSSIHRPKNVPCAFRASGCMQSFVSKSAMILHLESGSCPSGANHRKIREWVQSHDTGNVITVPQRTITYNDYFATERSWNSYVNMFECVLCHNHFRTLGELNRHLASPRHQEKIFRCPLETCSAQFSSLSGLCQHVESEKCGVLRFRMVREGMNRLFDGVNRLMIQGELREKYLSEDVALSMKIKVRYES